MTWLGVPPIMIARKRMNEYWITVIKLGAIVAHTVAIILFIIAVVIFARAIIRTRRHRRR